MKWKVEKLEQELKSNNLQTVYMFCGEEQYLLEYNVNKIKKIFGDKIDGINYIQLDENTIERLLPEIQTPAFGYEKKLIIIKNSNILKKETKKKASNIADIQKKLADYLEKNLQEIKQSVILVFIEEKIDKTPVVDVLEKCGIICEFDKLKPIELVARLKAIANQYEVQVSERTLNKLIETCGTSMQILINEIRKLIEYAGSGGTIEDKDVDKLAIPQVESVIFQLTDELGRKNLSKALDIYHQLLYKKEPVQMLLITLYRHFKKLYLVKLAASEKRDVAEVLQLKPNQMFLITKYKNQSGYFSIQDLREILKKLTMLDEKSKSGLIDLEVGLEAVLCNQI